MVSISGFYFSIWQVLQIYNIRYRKFSTHKDFYSKIVPLSPSNANPQHISHSFKGASEGLRAQPIKYLGLSLVPLERFIHSLGVLFRLVQVTRATILILIRIPHFLGVVVFPRAGHYFTGPQ